jgi:hypothetical protein
MGGRRYSTIAALDGMMGQIHVPVDFSAHKISDTHCKSGCSGFEFGLEGLKRSISLPVTEIKHQTIKSASSVIHRTISNVMAENNIGGP